MYISGGENVYPAEVEAALAELPEVGECAVVGVPDERWGEVGRAYVIPAPGKSITADQVIAHCTARLAKFKVPKTVAIGEEIPRTTSGKVQKHLLKARAMAELAGLAICTYPNRIAPLSPAGRGYAGLQACLLAGVGVGLCTCGAEPPHPASLAAERQVGLPLPAGERRTLRSRFNPT